MSAPHMQSPAPRAYAEHRANRTSLTGPSDSTTVSKATSHVEIGERIADAFNRLRDVPTSVPREPDINTIGMSGGAREHASRLGCRLDAEDLAAYERNGETPSDPQPPTPITPSAIFSYNPDAPISDRELVAEFGAARDFHGDDTVEGARGFRFGNMRDADRPRRPRRNLDNEYRQRAKFREAVRNDPSLVDELVSDDVVAERIVLNQEELGCQLLDLVCRPEADPALECGRIALLKAGRLGLPIPIITVPYVDALADRIAKGEIRLAQPRLSRRAPGVVFGYHAACHEHDVTPDEDEAIVGESRPVVLRQGIVIALRKREASRPKSKRQTETPRNDCQQNVA
jgi:hypothetical protein